MTPVVGQWCWQNEPLFEVLVAVAVRAAENVDCSMEGMVNIV
jgi:hypothetical protein